MKIFDFLYNFHYNIDILFCSNTETITLTFHKTTWENCND